MGVERGLWALSFVCSGFSICLVLDDSFSGLRGEARGVAALDLDGWYQGPWPGQGRWRLAKQSKDVKVKSCQERERARGGEGGRTRWRSTACLISISYLTPHLT